MIKIHPHIKSIFRLIFPLFLGLFVLWLLYRDMSLNDIVNVLNSDVDYGVLVVSLIFGLLANVLRGIRWHLLIRPIITQGNHPRLISAICTVLGSYTINLGIPRSGELWRCAEYKRHENLPFSSLFGTLINDRLADVLCLGLLLGLVILGYWEFFLNFFNQYTDLGSRIELMLDSSWLYFGLALIFSIGTTAYLYVRTHPEGRIAQTLHLTLQGILSIRSMTHRTLFCIYSIGIWGLYFLFFYTTFFAFPFTRTLPFEAGLIAFTMSSLSVIAPVQNGTGPWHFMVITTFVAYGVSKEDAGVFALIVHTMQTLWIAVVGLVAIIILPLLSKGYRRDTKSSDIL